MPPDFLAIGHVAKDLTPDGFMLGGAVTYGAVTAHRLGLSTAVVTSAESDLDLASALPGTQLHVVSSDQTTTFVNAYRGGDRSQTLKAVAASISLSDVPSSWRTTPLVLLGTLANELNADLAQGFPGALVVASIQGWLRQWDNAGRVSAARWDGADVLPHVDAAVCSTEDIDDRGLLDTWKELARALVVTEGKDGSQVHFDGRWHRVEPFLAREADPTGAGDVFATAYMVRYRETSDVLESARFASCAASFCVEAEGTAAIPTREQVEERLRLS